jgi:hypothetical protein
MLNHCIKYLFITGLTLSAFIAKGQGEDISRDTIEWHSEQAYNFKNQEQFQFVSYFKSFGESKVEWIQKSGSLVHTFIVDLVDGTWTNIQSNGEVVFNIRYEDKPGKITFSKSDNGTVVLLDLTNADPNGISYRFDVIKTN